MSDICIGDRVTASTSRGIVRGRVVGTETRDTTRHGTGEPVSLVCVVVDGGDAWQWLRADACERTEPPA